MARAFHLLPQGLVEDQPTTHIPLIDLPPVAEPIEEPPSQASSTPVVVPPAPPTTAPVPPAPVPSIPSEPPIPMPTDHSYIVGSSTSAPPE